MPPLTLYFHGLPGSAAELTSFGPEIAQGVSHFHVAARGDRLAAGPEAGYFARLAQQIAVQFPDAPLRLAGFSLGAAAALRVGPYLRDRVQQIDLVSPAAPLQSGDFLGGMAGAPVFRAALAGRVPLAALSWGQAQAARLAPVRMAAALMASARGADRALAADPRFLSPLALSLHASLITQRAAYLCEIMHYVSDWSDTLAAVQQPVTIWQGSEDNWTPPAMAQALADGLPGGAEVLPQPGLSHFSTLRAYLAAAARG